MLGILRSMHAAITQPHSDYYQQSLAMFRALGDLQGVAVIQTNLGEIARLRSDYAAAQVCFEQSLALYQEIDDRRYVAMPLFILGLIALDRGDYPAARASSNKAWRSAGQSAID